MYIIGKAHNAFSTPDVIGRQFRAFSKALGVIGTEDRPLTFHDLRHTYATLAIAGGADVKSVSDQLGHKNAAMTLNVYVSVLPSAKSKLANIIDMAAEI